MTRRRRNGYPSPLLEGGYPNRTKLRGAQSAPSARLGARGGFYEG